jgi:hypothetical protein
MTKPIMLKMIARYLIESSFSLSKKYEPTAVTIELEETTAEVIPAPIAPTEEA